jgi:hypothetical protein
LCLAVHTHFSILLRFCRQAGLQSQRVQLTAHSAAQSLINHLMLLNPVFAFKSTAFYKAGIMIPITGHIFNFDDGIWKGSLDKGLDFMGLHGHRASLLFSLS